MECEILGGSNYSAKALYMHQGSLNIDKLHSVEATIREMKYQIFMEIPQTNFYILEAWAQECF